MKTKLKNRQNVKVRLLISKIFFTKPLLYIFSFHFLHFFFLSLAVRLIYTCLRTIFLTQSQNNVLWIVCAEELKIECFHKIKSRHSQVFFKIGVIKNFAVFAGKHYCCSLLLIELQTWSTAKRLQQRCFPVNIMEFLRTPLLQNASSGCSCKMMKFYKYIC